MLGVGFRVEGLGFRISTGAPVLGVGFLRP